MKPWRGVGGVCALWLMAATASPVQAAWCNVFQVCCHSCGNGSVSYYAPDPCCNPCPQPVCTTRYVQRCYYQPVTCYQTKTYYEPVTTYRTSYYYEPVTTYRYSCYYDPCTCSYQQVACPTTTYRVRSQCCPVQSWVQRCCQVPVTTYQQCSYWEPVTTCCTPAAPPCDPPAAIPAAPVSPPAVTEQRSVPVPGVREYSERGTNGSGSPLYDRYYPPPASSMPPATNNSFFRQPAPPAATPPPPTVKLDRIVAAPVPSLQGQVVRRDRAPEAGAQLLFVSAAQHGPRHNVTADEAGRFRVTLASGGWLVYVQGADNKPVFHSKIELRDSETRQVTLVSR
jgi:hypothetical protein